MRRASKSAKYASSFLGYLIVKRGRRRSKFATGGPSLLDSLMDAMEVRLLSSAAESEVSSSGSAPCANFGVSF
jgi:hypothetical protein